jgi:N-acetylmuramoyl-L-alanine amidase CwlA
VNAAYFARKWERGPVYSGGKIITDIIEAGSVKDTVVNGVSYRAGTPFRYGSTQILFDHDSGTLAIPVNEVSWGCGDRNIPYTNEWLGQQKIAKRVFNNRQNYLTLNVEICNNDVYPDSNKDWLMAVDNALNWITETIKNMGKRVLVNESLDPQNFIGPVGRSDILLLRHYDITGKICPKPFVDDYRAWEEFVHTVAKLSA